MLDLNSMLIDDQNAALATMADNSYCDFHAPGLDYLCLGRGPIQTTKAYFFDRMADADKPVMPHNHRYDFYTQVLAGRCTHARFRLCSPTDPSPFKRTYRQRCWNSPLIDGGKGWDIPDAGRVSLVPMREEYMPGEGYFVSAEEIHDIDVDRETVLLITQFPNRIPRELPTSTYFPIQMMSLPDISGLYNRMTPSECAARYGQIMDLIG